MTSVLPHACDDMVLFIGDTRVPLEYEGRFREYALRVDSGTAVQLIGYCPWCGVRLPSSLRDEWFDALEARGVDPATDAVPDDFTNDRWWRSGSETSPA